MNASSLFGVRMLATGAVLAGVIPLFMPAMAASPAQPVSTVSQSEVFRGVVTTLTDETLTLNDDHVIDLRTAPACEQDGHAIMLADLRVGDRVKVTCFRDPQQDLPRALAIEVYR